MSRLQITQNFYLDEFTRSQTAARHGIDLSIEPGSQVLKNIERLCTDILQPIRDQLGPVSISSGYRPPELNRLIGGSSGSAHLMALAADFTVAGYTPYQVALWIAQHTDQLPFDQCIHEFGQWVHVGLAPDGEIPRIQLMTSYKSKPQNTRQRAKTAYAYGIHPMEHFKD